MAERIRRMKRVIVRGGRLVHAVRIDSRGIARTACGSRRIRYVDRPQPDDTPVTCRRCLAAGA